MTTKKILNIGSGKIIPDDIKNFNPFFLVNIDSNYYNNSCNISYIEDTLSSNLLNNKKENEIHYLNSNIFDFLSKSRSKFNRIYMYRFLEHIKKSDLLYFIYLLSTSLEDNGAIDIIVPNYNILAKRILTEDVNNKNFDKEDIITTTELLNEPNDPHASIWTPSRAKYYFEYENRFNINILSENYYFDGRDIYMRFEAINKI